MNENSYPDIVIDPKDSELAAEIAEFWAVAHPHAGIGRVEVVVGTSVAAAVAPPAWAFGDNPELADELVEAVLAGEKTATSTAAVEFGPTEPVPEPGDLSIVLDGQGHPRALIRTTSVEHFRFGDVPAEFAAEEGEGDRTLESWRREHEAYFSRVLGSAVSEDLDVVCERFELLYPHDGHHHSSDH